MSTPKKSVGCVSVPLFLLCQSRFILFLLGFHILFLLCRRYSRRRANFLNLFKNRNLLNLMVMGSSGVTDFCFRVTRLATLTSLSGNTMYPSHRTLGYTAPVLVPTASLRACTATASLRACTATAVLIRTLRQSASAMVRLTAAHAHACGLLSPSRNN
jgi:hypothetical protein